MSPSLETLQPSLTAGTHLCSVTAAKKTAMFPVETSRDSRDSSHALVRVAQASCDRNYRVVPDQYSLLGPPGPRLQILQYGESREIPAGPYADSRRVAANPLPPSSLRQELHSKVEGILLDR